MIIADDQVYFRSARGCCCSRRPARSCTVLAFILLGDAVRDALDPKLR